MSNTADVQQQIINAFNFRHACKVFDPQRKISDDEFNTILEAARLSPSSFGFEPWQILVVQSPEKRELFRDFAWGANGATNGTAGQLGTASHFVIFLAHTDATMHHHSDYLQKHMREVKKLPEEVIGFINQAYEKFQTHDFGVEGKRQVADWSARQVYIALGNMMTAAALLGIDSCPIEGFEMAKTVEVLQEHFGIDPERYQPAVMVAFGYRAGEPPFAKTRRPMDQVVSWF
ncbi:NAD(P)H-dependent oxidoreductase [Microbulbifer thermotolerans]|uniref:NAD(P)H-dependent oxidoreductase n=2 Tax=Microbulbifer thermotolerans TaxID=252514 RepID=A0AB35HWP9_MICTH|nr:NAD(P)H-dependent oxidoreductase [Microbulbifer thermotolerans]MCX2778531.1 NAD(P)H-dependent oxidoreductase [Microbulbifer thermotolerans]MCX2794015.1 NAD(P)H-dependent oxidoreductase [Microbulbifer thermotolerans]MCX2801719.1 NAD(P)H-dependent oxidoreductase [Microbulbifer thermotolerans]MCX2803960.1 NAD(P)H-dependent oxidoreductase [Microbulbifer thermotolerans]MCX2830788.1 NAD(P)H-dependent oxidoreductase [Microbulbifer thermotolerans]